MPKWDENKISIRNKNIATHNKKTCIEEKKSANNYPCVLQSIGDVDHETEMEMETRIAMMMMMNMTKWCSNSGDGDAYGHGGDGFGFEMHGGDDGDDDGAENDIVNLMNRTIQMTGFDASVYTTSS